MSGFDTAGMAGLAAQIFTDIAAFSPDVRGVSRPAFSATETQALDYLDALARRHQLRCWRDAGANLVIGAADDTDPGAPAGYFGSHVDTVPEGGNFDGLAGVVAGLVTLISLTREGWAPRVPLRVLALRGEESAWFGHAYMGSQALMGQLGAQALASRRRDGKGTLADALAAAGLPLDRIRAGERLMDPRRMTFFVELHIEQGPVLTERGWPVAAVTGIRGNFRHRAVKCVGAAGHSGAVPRALRRDTVFATADLLMRMDARWRALEDAGDDLVMTVGMIQTDAAHHAPARIPGEVTFAFEARSQDEDTLAKVEGLLHAESEAVARARKVRFDFDEAARAPTAKVDPGILKAILAATEAEGLPAEKIPSGAGHDSAIFARPGVPVGMLFVRNRNGSHNPDEAMEIDDLMAGVRVLRGLARELTK